MEQEKSPNLFPLLTSLLIAILLPAAKEGTKQQSTNNKV